jgi:hypothetical protein
VNYDNIKFRVFWDVLPCSQVVVDRRFRRLNFISAAVRTWNLIYDNITILLQTPTERRGLVVRISASNSGGPGFKSRHDTGHFYRFFVVLLSPVKQMLEWHPKLGHDRFLRTLSNSSFTCLHPHHLGHSFTNVAIRRVEAQGCTGLVAKAGERWPCGPGAKSLWAKPSMKQASWGSAWVVVLEYTLMNYMGSPDGLLVPKTGVVPRVAKSFRSRPNPLLTWTTYPEMVEAKGYPT